MVLMRWLFCAFLTLTASASSAQVPDAFAQAARWTASETWNSQPLVYTFEPNGTFKSSDWDNGKGQGTWTRAGKMFVMIWPHYSGALYSGTIDGQEIRGTAYRRDGSAIGTFVFRLAR